MANALEQFKQLKPTHQMFDSCRNCGALQEGHENASEGTSAHLSGRGELHGGARVTTLVTLRKCTLGNKREIKTLKFVLASTKGF